MFKYIKAVFYSFFHNPKEISLSESNGKAQTHKIIFVGKTLKIRHRYLPQNQTILCHYACV